MALESQLGSIVLAHATPSWRAELEHRGDADDIAARWLAEAHEQWPSTWVADAQFVAYVTARLPAEGRADDISALRIADLYLACACNTGDQAAIAAFEAAYTSDVRRVLGTQSGADISLEELLQEVCSKLFVAADKPPRIAEYAGRSSLRSWLRVVVSRSLVDMQRRRRRRPEESGENEAMWQLAASDDSPELTYVKKTYRSAFKEAFEQAIAALTPQQRVLLRQQYVDQLTLEELAELHQVHRTSVARRLAKARQAVVANMRRSLTAALAIDRGEVENLMHLVRSRLDLSLSRVLSDDSAG